MYYRLYDKQTGRYMATGYNAKSKTELINDYISYKSEGMEDEDIEELKNDTVDDVISFIEADEFTIEESEEKFDEDDLEDSVVDSKNEIIDELRIRNIADLYAILQLLERDEYNTKRIMLVKQVLKEKMDNIFLE